MHVLPRIMIIIATSSAAAALCPAAEKSETFDRDPGWDGVNNRSAHTKPPRTVRQDFGYSRTNHCGGNGAGEVGGFVTPAAEAAYYAAPIATATFGDKLTASGTFACPDGEFHLLLGFFNSGTVNEWRTPNTIALRLNGRGKTFLAYTEYLTSKWRIGTIEEAREKGFSGEFPSGGSVSKWSLTYDPKGDSGKPVLTAAIGDKHAILFPDPK